MKNLVIIFLVFSSFSLLAQPGATKEEREERIKAQKIAFISNELELTPEEAEKFWPVYNQYEDELESKHKEKRKAMKQLRDIDELSEEEAHKLTKRIFELEAQETEIRLKYLDKFADVLGKKKASMVFMAEEKFKRELLKRIKQGRQGPHGGPGGGPHR